MQNATAAAWIDYTDPIQISLGDKITISVFDKDMMYDDLIGQEELSIDELLEISATAKEINFGFVDLCTLKCKEIK